MKEAVSQRGSAPRAPLRFCPPAVPRAPTVRERAERADQNLRGARTAATWPAPRRQEVVLGASPAVSMWTSGVA